MPELQAPAAAPAAASSPVSSSSSVSVPPPLAAPAVSTTEATLLWAVGGVALFLLVLLVYAALTRKKRGEERRSEGGSSMTSLDAGEGEKGLGPLIRGLKMPFIFFVLLLTLYEVVRLSPLSSGPLLNLWWFRLVVFVVGVYVVAELGFRVVVDHFLMGVQGWEIPQIFYQMMKIGTFTLVYMPILSSQFQFDITPLLTTSAVVTMVIGLALQNSLDNLFSGIAMQIQNPFKLGDWIGMGAVDGKVVEVNWRATTIRTRSNDLVTFPNGNIAKSEVKNYSRPSKLHAVYLDVGLAYDASPELAMKVLVETALTVEEVAARPAPIVLMRKFGDSSIEYALKYFVNDYGQSPNIDTEVRKRLWYALRRAGLDIPFPIRTVHMVTPRPADDDHIERSRLLSKVDFLTAVSDNGLQELSRRLKEEMYPTECDVVRHGDQGDTFYFVRRGRLAVLVPQEGAAEPLKVAELGPGQCFGEMSLLTGQARSATVRTLEETVTLTLDHDAFRLILQKEPKLVERISEVIVNRQKANQAQLAKSSEDRAKERGDAPATSDSRREQENLLRKIIVFFGI